MVYTRSETRNSNTLRTVSYGVIGMVVGSVVDAVAYTRANAKDALFRKASDPIVKMTDGLTDLEDHQNIRTSLVQMKDEVPMNGEAEAILDTLVARYDAVIESDPGEGASAQEIFNHQTQWSSVVAGTGKNLDDAAYMNSQLLRNVGDGAFFLGAAVFIACIYNVLRKERKKLTDRLTL